jgi:hypothetical protein
MVRVARLSLREAMLRCQLLLLVWLLNCGCCAEKGRKEGRKEGREEERWVVIDTPVLQSIDRYQTLFCMEAAAPIDCGSPMP